VAREPRAEGLLVERAILRVEAAQRQRGPHRSRAVGGGEVGVARERAGEMQRGGQPRAPQAAGRPARRQHGDVEPRLQRRRFARAEALEQREVVGTAAQEDVLPVVEAQAVAVERVGGAAEARTDLEQRHARAGVGAVQRGGDAGEAAADDCDVPGHRAPTSTRPVAARPAALASEPAATHAFSHGGSEMRPRSTSPGERSMRSRMRR
jgi:hypothetical protein